MRLVLAGMVAAGLAACASAPADRGAMTAHGAYAPRIERTSGHLQCVAYARGRSGISIYGDAGTWWDQAAGRYPRTHTPEPGAVAVLGGYKSAGGGHLAYVTKVLGPRKIVVDHANWLNDGDIHRDTPMVDVSPSGDWSQVRVWNAREGHLGGRIYQVRGFILPEQRWADAGS